ncbi:MAG: 16S rRNA (uracil(1498)-N(3))-methyltransferase [[Ruminococcus] gnavus]|nr:16S rRNA (uracil(1498)-N(3))-methyltransferase [Mediterraneibacter gnavus]
MQNFFVYDWQVQGDMVTIEGTDVNHIVNVLRMKVGEEVSVHDDVNRKYLCRIAELQEDKVCLSILEQQASDTELPCRIYLFQGLPKGDKMEWIIQKGVELGAYAIVPVATKRAVVKLDEKKAQKKVARWNSIAESAAKQSGRGMIPEVLPVMKFAKALEFAKDLDLNLIPYEKAEGIADTKQRIAEIRPGQSIGIFIGPEGGFEEAEVEMAKEMQAVPVTLGRRILRTETAGMTMLSILMYHLESE